MVKREGREGRLPGRPYECHDHSLPGGHSLLLAYVPQYRLVGQDTETMFFAAHQPMWYTPTAARTTDESHRHSAKQLVQQCSNLHVNKRDSSWVPKALAREGYRDSLTLLHWDLRALSIRGS